MERRNQNFVSEMSELYTAGLTTTEYLENSLKDTRFQKYFNVYEKDAKKHEEYYSEQYVKFSVLYTYFKDHTSSKGKLGDDFFENLSKELEKTHKEIMDVNGFDITNSFSPYIVQKIFEESPKVQEEALKLFYSSLLEQNFKDVNPNTYEFYSREQTLNKTVAYLVEFAQSDKFEKRVREIALRLIIMIANIRESAEDFLIAYNIIASNSIKVNLYPELTMNPHLQNQETLDEVQKEEKFSLDQKIFQQFEIYPALSCEIKKEKHTRMTFDNKFMYLYNIDEGIFKIGHSETPNSAPGLIYESSNNKGLGKASLACIQGKLFCRRGAKDNDSPLEVFDIHKLNKTDSEEFKAKIEETKRKPEDFWNKPIMEYTESLSLNDAFLNNDLETYRSVQYSPIFSDGDKLFMLSTHILSDKISVSHYEVEIYDPETWNFVSKVKLNMSPKETEELSSEKKDEISEDSSDLLKNLSGSKILEQVYCTNGEMLAICVKEKIYFFSLKTGNRYPDVIKIPYDRCEGYDPEANAFWFWNNIQSDDDSDEGEDSEYEENSRRILVSSQIFGFKSKYELDKTKIENIENFITKKTQEVLKIQKVEQRREPANMKDFLKKLQDRDLIQPIEFTDSENDSEQLSLYLIMNILHKGCDEMENVLSKLELLNSNVRRKKLKLQTQLYRSKFSINLTSTFVKELVKCLQRFSTFLDQEMNDDNILKQYEFLWLLQIINKFTISLSKLKIKLEDIVSNEKIRSLFSKLIPQIITELVEKGCERVLINTKENEQEINSIWNAVVTESRDISQRITSLISQPQDQILDNIKMVISDITNKKIDSSGVMFLKFLSSSEIIKNPVEYSELEALFNKSCDLVSQKYRSEIQNLTLNELYQDLEFNDYEIECIEFIRCYLIQIILYTYKPLTDLKKNDKKTDELKQQVVQRMPIFSRIYEKLLNSCQTIFEIANEVLKNTKNEVSQVDSEAWKTEQSFNKYFQAVYNICFPWNNFYKQIHCCFAVIVSEQEHIMEDYYTPFYLGTAGLLREVVEITENDPDKDNSNNDQTDQKNKKEILPGCRNFLFWGLSKISHSLIKLNPSIPKAGVGSQNLLRANIFSAGIQNRFISSFSEKTRKSIQNFCKITGQNELAQYVSQPELGDEEKIMLALIYQGKDQQVDKLIELLQWDLVKKNPAAKVGGDKGMLLSRCAFASNIALNRYDEECSFTNLLMMMDQIDIFMEDCDQNMPLNQKNKECIEELKSLETVNGIFDLWKSASKMRIWLQEKRKDISNSTKREFEKKLKAEATQNQESLEEEKITTTQSSNPNQTQTISEDELLKIENERIQIIVKKI